MAEEPGHPPPETVNTSTGDAGMVVQARTINGGVHVGTVNLVTGLPVRSQYHEQVQRIAPPCLVDRDAELAALEIFCTAPSTAGTYAWWRADAWSGKSALMSWFVLHPPPGVRIVSFFVTARWASQNDRGAFIDNVLEQLLTLLGEAPPPLLTESTREAHLLGLLRKAGEACERRGEQFVLLVDGLDEDRGLHDGPDTHSIAALLPVKPPAGLRVIVAGRPNPPVPADVPAHHPLRDDTIIRPLAPSPQAQTIREEMERELKRLLRGTTAEQDLLGLVAAAGGGLSAADLAELTEWSAWQVEDQLKTVAGRSFSRRLSHFRPATAPDVYVLGHEELQTSALEMMGPVRLDGYRERLHDWAGHYCRRDWPAETPEYLLRDYFRMLQANDDVRRMIACALDKARHDRMLAVGGADAAALTEITNTQDAILGHDAPDLRAMTLLSVHRDQLEARNASIPSNLPGVVALLGDPLRAEALVWAIPDRREQLRALATVIQALTECGDHLRAEALADEFVRRARANLIQDPGMWATLRDLPGVLTRAGYRTHTEMLEPHIDAKWRAWSSAETDERLNDQTDTIHAEHEVFPLEVEQIREFTIGSDDEARAKAKAARKWCRAGNIDRAEETARSIAYTRLQALSLTAVVWDVARRGDVTRAEEIAHCITDPRLRAWSLAEAASAAARQGDRNRAEVLAYRAEETARSITEPTTVTFALAQVAQALADVGHTSSIGVIARAVERIAQSISDPDPDQHARALANAAQAWAAAGEFDHAEDLARRVTNPFRQSLALGSVAQALARAGRVDRAGAMVRSSPDPMLLPLSQENVVVAAIEAGKTDHAERLAWSITDSYYQARALATLARARATTGKNDHAKEIASEAEKIAWSLEDDFELARAIAECSRAWAATARIDYAKAIAGDAEEIAWSIDDPGLQPSVLAEVIRAWAAVGELGHAEELAWNIADVHSRAAALVNLAPHTSPARAPQLIAHALRLDNWKAAIDALAVTLPDVLVEVANELLAGLPAAP